MGQKSWLPVKVSVTVPIKISDDGRFELSTFLVETDRSTALQLILLKLQLLKIIFVKYVY